MLVPPGERSHGSGMTRFVLLLVVSCAACGATRSGGRLVWLGGPTAILERGGLRLLTDPMLGPRAKVAFTLPRHPSTGEENGPVARYTDPPAVPLGRLDAVVLSHGHNDHFDRAAREKIPRDTPFIVNPNIAPLVREAGFTDVRTLDWGESTVLERGATKLTITAVPGHHAHDPALDELAGKVNGYILSYHGPDGRLAIYWTGDSVLYDGQAEIVARHAPIDLLLPHMGGVGGDGRGGLRTMDAEEAVQLIAAVRPRRVIPIHHTTFGHYREPVSALVQRVAQAGTPVDLHVVAEGDTAPLAP
jgi:L-ascorbate metabolism protein UlaG (beta-lactamase superfamily)